MNLPRKKPTKGPYQERYYISEKRPSTRFLKDGNGQGPMGPPANIVTI
jgi:hypothetical protein